MAARTTKRAPWSHESLDPRLWMRESRRVKAAKKFITELKGDDFGGEVLSSWGPYTSTIGQVYKKNDLSLPAVTTRAMDSTKMPAVAK